MPSFDRRVVDEDLLELVRALQRRGECHLAGGAVLAGVHLGHRHTRDLDVFVHDASLHRELVRALPAAAAEAGVDLEIVRDGGSFVRAVVQRSAGAVEIDLVHEAVADLEPPPAPIDGVVVESLADLRASKITCLLSRSEPRDLVDVLFLERAGYPLDDDLDLALKKDAGIDPGILAWLLERFPTQPLPEMIASLTEAELRAYRDELAERLRRLAVGA